MPSINLGVARSRDTSGIRRRIIAAYTGPASYPTGGEAFEAKHVQLSRIEHIKFNWARNNAGDLRLVLWDHTNNKTLWYVPSTGNEVAALTNLSGFTTRFEAAGY